MRHAPAPAAARSPSPPRPPGYPLLGHLPWIARDAPGFFTKCARDHGGVVALALGGWPAVLVSDPRVIEPILVRSHASYIKHNFFWRHVRAIFGEGLLTSNGALWQRQRRLAAPAFAGRKLDGYGDVMVRMTEEMLGSWAPGQVRDLHADMMGLTLRIAAKTLFGSEVEEEVERIDHAVTLLMEEIAARYARPVLIPDAVPLPGHIRYRRSIEVVETVIARIVEERRARPTDTGDLLSLYMQARDEDGRGMTDRQLRDEMVTLLLAGHETTALVLSWAWYELARHPRTQERLAAEIDAVLCDRPATVEDLRRLPFAESVAKESMRLYPPGWAIGRETTEEVEIGGYRLAKGTTVIMAPWVLHRDPRHFDDPDAFRPERWEDGLEERLPRFAYMPFGGGPRVCIGGRFSMMEAVLILVTIARRFRLAPVPGRETVPFPSITLRPKGGVWVEPRARGDA
ncbi:cytochrome P450 [Salinarimonas rosea]|uniref:cytochrome P450 n=1 Tax=Salinarimonas rosea TaxID=552063 RepID=UPI00042606E0|nr:cytochrome P450 [Salinarimonas rosea]